MPTLLERRLPHLPVEELELANGMRFLLVDRPQASTVSAGWVATVGSAWERPGESGLSHFIEHLMFKGTRTVGARGLDFELGVLADLDRAMEEVVRIETRTRKSAKDLRRLEELRQRTSMLEEMGRGATFPGELSLLYSNAGATGLNANTLEDLTMYYVTVPAERLELWFWLESDRLRQPVFRELYQEKRVIEEERQLRVGSTPTGTLDETFRRRFWNELPYAWLPLGAQDDVDRQTRGTVRAFFDRHYSPPNLTAVLVGRFDRARVAELAELYFGRLEGLGTVSSPGPFDQPEPNTEPLVATCDCTPQAQLRYPSVPFRHPDSYKLQVLAGLLNGRTGRLYRSLVLEQQIAYSASVLQHPLRRAGSFLFSAEARDQMDPKALVRAWQEELERLVSEPLDEGELAKVKKLIAADAYRRLQDPESLMRQLLIYDGLGEWRHINDWPERILRVEGRQVVEVAERYLLQGKPATALYYRAGHSRTVSLDSGPGDEPTGRRVPE